MAHAPLWSTNPSACSQVDTFLARRGLSRDVLPELEAVVAGLERGSSQQQAFGELYLKAIKKVHYFCNALAFFSDKISSVYLYVFLPDMCVHAAQFHERGEGFFATEASRLQKMTSSPAVSGPKRSELQVSVSRLLAFICPGTCKSIAHLLCWVRFEFEIINSFHSVR